MCIFIFIWLFLSMLYVQNHFLIMPLSKVSAGDYPSIYLFLSVLFCSYLQRLSLVTWLNLGLQDITISNMTTYDCFISCQMMVEWNLVKGDICRLLLSKLICFSMEVSTWYHKVLLILTCFSSSFSKVFFLYDLLYIYSWLKSVLPASISIHAVYTIFFFKRN